MKTYRITTNTGITYTILAESADSALDELEGSDYLADYTKDEIEDLEIVNIEEEVAE